MRWGSARLSRRVARSLPWIGAAIAIVTVASTMRRKGVISGALDSGLNAVPFVGLAKNVVEVARGRDFFPDRYGPGSPQPQVQARRLSRPTEPSGQPCRHFGTCRIMGLSDFGTSKPATNRQLTAIQHLSHPDETAYRAGTLFADSTGMHSITKPDSQRPARRPYRGRLGSRSADLPVHLCQPRGGSLAGLLAPGLAVPAGLLGGTAAPR